jgi:hypothetical protein
MEKEIWKSVPNYIGYEVSSLGRVRSLDRISVSGYRLKGKVLKQSVSGTGYIVVGLNANTKYVHQLVAMAFLGHEPCGYKVEVNHIDENKCNNRLDNLEVLTQEEHKSRKHKTSKYYGVSWSKATKKWQAQIRVDGKQIHLSYFTNEIDAHNAYQKKLKEIS